MKINWQKVLFATAGIAGVVAIFFFSWFWRLLLTPILVIIFWDLASSFFSSKKS